MSQSIAAALTTLLILLFLAAWVPCLEWLSLQLRSWSAADAEPGTIADELAPETADAAAV